MLLDARAIGSAGGGGAPLDATFITQTPNATLTNEQALSALATGILKSTTTTGVLSIAAEGTDYYAPGGTDVAIADGGTGQSTAQSSIDALTNVAAATNEHVLTKDTATGNAVFKVAAAGGGVAGSDTQIQFNDGGAFGADADLIWNKTTNLLTVTGLINSTEHYQISGDRILHRQGTNNLFAGQNAGNFTLTGTENVGVGGLALNALSTGTNNVAVGFLALANSLTTGSNNVAVGRRALANYSGSSTIAIGTSALSALTSGTTNVAVGVSALSGLTTNGGSTAVGASALSGATGGSNTALGGSSGGGLTTGSNNTFLGAGTGVTVNSVSNSIALGFAALCTKNGQFVIGSAAVPITEFSFIGGSFNYRPTDTATTNAVVNVPTFRLNSSGTPAAGFGLGMVFQGESSTTENQDMGRLTYEWATATHASRKALSKWSVFDTAEREAIRIEASGSAAMLGVLGAAAIARPAAYTLAGVATRTMPTPEAAFTGQDNAQVGAVYAKSADLITLQTRLDSAEGVLRQLIIDLASTSGYGLLVAS